MADEVSFTIKGVKDVQKALYSYSQQLGDRVIRGALREGAKVVQSAARSIAPSRTGNLRREIVIANSRINNGRRSKLLGVYLRIRRRSPQDKRNAYYGRFIHDGWNTHGPRGAERRMARRKSGMTTRVLGGNRKTLPGKTTVPGKPFMTDGLAKTRGKAVDQILRAVEAGAEILKRKVGLK